jgi:hypothetical protein
MRMSAKIDKMAYLGGKTKTMKKAEKDVFNYLKAQFDKVINAYGWTEQGRLVISTMMLMVVYDAKDVARNLSKATFYRHMAMLKDSGVDLNESVYNELKEIYKLPKELR